MAQQKTDPTGTRQQKRMHIMNGWNQAKEERMPEIYCLGVCTHSPRECTRGPGPRTRHPVGVERQKKQGGGVEVRRQEEGEEKNEGSKGDNGGGKEEGGRGGGSEGEGRKRRMKLRSSRIPPFIWLSDEEQARPARQKISKIRRVARGTVCPGAPSRIYKERSHDLCRGLGYLSISMVHAIPLHGYRYVLASNARSRLFFSFFSSPSFTFRSFSSFPSGFRPFGKR